MQAAYRPWLMWFFPVLFFAYQFILRLWPGLMIEPIMAQFSIDASQFGLLAACYYYGYAGMQVPLALLLDRFGPRWVMSLFVLLCGLSMWLFTYTSHFYWALVSRFLIGVGSAVGFLGVSKVISMWFPKEAYARMVGLSFTFGLMGAIYGGKPVGLLIEIYHWHAVAWALLWVAVAISVCLLWVLRSSKNNLETIETTQLEWKQMRHVLQDPALWLLAMANLLMVGALEGFADVWGVPYLMLVYHLKKADAAGLMSCIFFGMLFGGPLLAAFTRRGRDYPVILGSALGMGSIFVILLSVTHLSMTWLSLLLGGLGILCCYQVIVFSAGSKLVQPAQLGVTVAFLNCMNMLGGSFFHTLIGSLMDRYWLGAYTLDGSRQYPLEAFHHALLVIPISAFLGGALMIIKEIFFGKKAPVSSL